MPTTVYWAGVFNSVTGIYATVFPGGATTGPLASAGQNLCIAGSKIVYHNDQQVFSVNLDGSGNAAVTPGTISTQLEDIWPDPSNTSVVICDKTNSRLVRVNLSNGAVTSLGSFTFLNTSGGPGAGVCYDASGRLFVAYTSGGKLVVSQLNPATGAILQTSSPITGAVPDSMCFDPVSGQIWVADVLRYGLQPFNPATLAAGSFIAIPGPLSVTFTNFDGVTADGLGNLYMGSDAGGDVIVVFNIATQQFTSGIFVTNISGGPLGPQFNDGMWTTIPVATAPASRFPSESTGAGSIGPVPSFVLSRFVAALRPAKHLPVRGAAN